MNIAIAAGHIAAVTQDAPVGAAETLDLDGRVVLPGFVEGHIHLDKALTAGLLPNRSGTLKEALEITRQFERQASQADVYARARETALWALRCGSTTIRTHVNVGPAIGLKGLHALVDLRERLTGLVDIQIVALPQRLLGPEWQEGRDLLDSAMREGADAVGGVPLNDTDPGAFVDEIFRIAARHDKPIDLHVDESGSPADCVLGFLAGRTLTTGYQGRVVAGHCCSLSSVDDRTAATTIENVARAGISVATLPGTNLYLQGRGEPHPVRRGLTRVKELIAAGVNVFCGSDNIKDMFNPLGRPDPLLSAHMLGHAAQMGSPDEQGYLLRSITNNPAAALGIESGLSDGSKADLVVLDTRSLNEILADLSPCLLVIKEGRVVSGEAGLYRTNREAHP